MGRNCQTFQQESDYVEASVMNGHFPRWPTEGWRSAELETWPDTGSTNPQGPITKIRLQQDRYCTPIRSTAHRKWNNSIPNHWFLNRENNVVWMLFPFALTAVFSVSAGLFIPFLPQVPTGGPRGLLLQQFPFWQKCPLAKTAVFAHTNVVMNHLF